jgi:hypothetical protein
MLVFIGTSFIGMVSSKVQGSYFRLAVAEFYLVVFTSTKSFLSRFRCARDFSFISLLTTMGVLILF